MTETFSYLFGGWRRADARRWVNPDGSQGGIVATSAKLDRSLVVPSDATIWPDARIYYRHYMQDEADDGGEQWCGQDQHERARAVRDSLHDLEPFTAKELRL